MPLVPYLFACMAGILVAYYTRADVWISTLWVLVLAYVILWLSLSWRNNWHVWQRLGLGILAIALFVLMGAWRFSQVYASKRVDFFLIDAPSNVLWLAEISGVPTYKGTLWRADAKMLTYRDADGSWCTLSGELRVRLYMSQQASGALPDYGPGDRLLIQGKPKLAAPPYSPYDFDYSLHLRRNNIFLTQWLSKKDHLLLATRCMDIVCRLQSWLGSWQRWLKHGILQAGLDTHQGVLLAMSLGDKSEIQESTRQLYAHTGASHVLAVSGLHVGILYLLMQAIWQPRRYRQRRWLFALSTIPLLWMYALLTGSSPSVLRAALMFSFFVIAQASNRHTNPYNTLAASALLLLLANPMLLFQVGFQLSYLAVWGILFFYPRLLELWQPRIQLLRWIYSLIAVSLAAQIATLPLVLYYFRLMPVAGIPSSLVVVPLAPMLLVGSLLLGAGIHAAADSLGWLLSGISWVLAQTQSFIEASLLWLNQLLPAISLDTWSWQSTLMLYGLLVVGALGISGRWQAYPTLLAANSIMLLLILWQGWQSYQQQHRRQIIVWADKKQSRTHILLGAGKQQWQFSCDSLAGSFTIRWSEHEIVVVNRWQKNQDIGKPSILIWNTKAWLPPAYTTLPNVLLANGLSFTQRYRLRQQYPTLHDLTQQGYWQKHWLNP